MTSSMAEVCQGQEGERVRPQGLAGSPAGPQWVMAPMKRTATSSLPSIRQVTLDLTAKQVGAFQQS